MPAPLYPPVRLGRLEEYHAHTARSLVRGQVRAIVTDARVGKLLGVAALRARPALGLHQIDALLARGTGGLSRPRQPDDLALVQFSSGSTVEPKPVGLTHTNVLANAAKYSPHGSRVALSVHRAGAEAVVTVADQGAGIPQDMLAHIFDMFTQVDRTLDEAQGGLGIGLALVKRLVEMHGGAVSASSAGLGAGSTFTLRLPTVGDAEGLDHPIAPLEVAACDTRLRLLIVDDDVDTAESLAELLSLNGHETRVADSGGKSPPSPPPGKTPGSGT